MTLSANCSSPKTAVPAMINVPIPTAVAKIPAGTPQHGLHGCSTLRTDEVRKLAEKRTFRGLLPKGEAGDCDYHDQHRHQRENRVICDCRTHRWGSVVEPLVSG